MFYFRCYQHEHIAQKRITLFHCLGFFGQRINIYLLLEEQMLAEAGVGEVATLLVEEGMVLALLATIKMKTEDQ